MIVVSPYTELKRKSGLIVVEGVNGAGKSTVCSHCINFIKTRDLESIRTFEPGDTPLGRQIREIVLGEKRSIAAQMSELFLFEADRAEHVELVIKPSLKQNKIVVCDRFTYSTTAFQGYGRGIDLNTIDNLNQIAAARVKPDFVLLLDLDPNIGLLRNKKSAVNGDTFSVDALEHEEIEFHARIRNGFLEIAKNTPEPFIIIDASKPLDYVMNEVSAILNVYLG